MTEQTEQKMMHGCVLSLTKHLYILQDDHDTTQ